MLGCRLFPQPHSKATFPEWWKVRRIWAWTEWFYEDLEKHAIKVSEDEAARTPGIIGMHRPHEMADSIGHIAVSLGGNRIIEAHGESGPDRGLIACRGMRGRFAHWYKLRRSKAGW
jgi:hypothetical protein